MRKLAKPTEQAINEGPQTVSFQILNGNARQGCILQTKFPTKIQAQKYLLTGRSSKRWLATLLRRERLKATRSNL